MDGQMRLYRGAPEALTISCSWSLDGGWRATLACRRSGEGWDEADKASYDHLASAELLDVLLAELDRLYGG